jgi:protein TonB
MSSYRGTADRPDRAKAIIAVVAVHAALAMVILTGLNVRMVRQAVQNLTTIDIKEPPPPPPVKPPPPAPKPQQMKKAAGAPAPKAEPTPVVAPQPKLPVPSTIPAAKIAGAGSASSSGASTSGTGTGAGGTGNGPGGGGSGDYSGYTPARQLTGIPSREYRRIAAAAGMPNGRASLSFDVAPNGHIYNCRTTRSSGNAYADELLCQLAQTYVRFSPARDPSGKVIWQAKSYSPSWHQNW